MTNKITQAEFEKRVRKHYQDQFGFLSKYINSKTKIKIKCNKCGYTFNADPASFMRGKGGCRGCYGRCKLTTEQFQEKINKIYPNQYKVIGKYKGTHIPILVCCLSCGYGKHNEWKPTPSNLLRGHGCPKCSYVLPLTEKEVRDTIEYEGNNQYKLINMYKPGTDQLITVKHLVCGAIYRVTYYHFKAGNRCPHCMQSLGEKRVDRVLSSYYKLVKNKDYISQFTFNNLRYKKKLRFDFYLPEYKIAIEYDGIQHRKPVDFAGKGKKWAKEQFKLNQERDQIKDKYCKKNNIRLIRINSDKYRGYSQIEEYLREQLIL